MPHRSPSPAWILLLVLLLPAGCGRRESAPAIAPAMSATSDGDLVPGRIFADRLAPEWYGPDLVVIPAGEFELGASKRDKQAPDSEKPAHRVVLTQPFALARTETTVAQFAEFVRRSGYVSLAERRGYSEVFDLASGRLVRGVGVDWRHDHLGKPARPEQPVVHVAYADAVAYTRWLSERSGRRYRLPSEAEWEYVLRAGGEGVYPWGDKPKHPQQGNLAGDRDRFPNGRNWRNAIGNYADGHWALAPVLSYASEPFGTFDMLGNVSEWVEDCWHENYRRAPADGGAWVNPGCRQRVQRGSAWLSSVDQSRMSFRLPADADRSNPRLGFRVAREL